MLTWSALLLIGGTSLLVTALVSCATLLGLRLARRLSLAGRLAVVLAAALVSIAVSAVAVGREMYLSGHDVAVLGWVIGLSSAFSLAAAWWVAHRTVRTSIEALVSSARRVGRGDVVDPDDTGWREFDTVSAELAETSRRLSEARAQLAELDAARRQFFAWISHDLRTPLAGMRAMAEAVETGTAPDPQEYVRLIRTKVDTLSRLVGDVFELSRLQSGTLDLHPEPVVLLDLVSDAVSDVQTTAESRGIRIVQDGVDGHLIWADPRELTRALGNLLANGVRHAPDGSTIVIRADTLRNDELLVSVIDQGPGVTAENLGRMFDVGWRADSSRTSPGPESSQGAGLGLAIVRGIVEAHGGRVQASRTEAGFQLDLVLPSLPH